MDMHETLNPAQKQAVITTAGPVLILAGAGSGKTKTLTHRIAHLIKHENVWPNEILAVTFTNKAAKEMRTRLGELLGQDGTNRSFMLWMGTFHSICVGQRLVYRLTL
jgi:DNA helicase-2/ATP-dependent DNA helicase PcrA